MIDIDRVRNWLIEAGSITEVAHVTMFQGRRKNTQREPQTVTVKLLDLGPTAQPDLRYYCEATSEEGKSATGNNAGTIEEAIAILHWNDLD